MNTSQIRDVAAAETAPAPYSTDGTDFRGALKYYYGVALKKFAKWGIPWVILWAQMFAWPMEYRGYMLPFSIVGMIGFVFTVFLFGGRMRLTWRCSRVFRAYPLVFRGPVEKVKLERPLRFHLRFGKQAEQLPTLLAKEPLGLNRWPEGIANGVWFAGDDPFGGAAIVPGTGELLFMQPSEWGLSAKERDTAGEVRIKQAKRAGIKKAVSYR
ncbi:hypothetical protein [Streptomyces poonensis]|uniref:Uncharacterized protein n=1 Tax=Streptomyces poonensis TaxID=68255 RepID=A0A918QBX3_9ACTN|nr:hypothetical protein [Streptomyces poonensis]GGZ39224.1 hypothetical protein GCM10010365_69970 [Streptomyces poonensis]GLJ93111.1 hypothetical protein GCM10017589_57230 [Streptomyces poonensis]